MKTSATPSATARARLGLIVSMTVFGTIGLFVRRIEITSAELALCRAGLAAVFLLLSFLVTRRRLCLSEIKKSLWLLLASGAAMGINWMLLFEAYQYTTISLATLSYYLAPVIVTALCPLLFHEKMTRAQVLCFLMSTLGVALIIGSGSVHGGASDVRGICFGVSAAVFYAAVILLNKYITGVPALERTFVQFLAAILVLAPYVALTSGFHPEVLSATGWVNLLIVGFVHTGVTYCIYFAAIRTLPGQESSLLSYPSCRCSYRCCCSASRSPRSRSPGWCCFLALPSQTSSHTKTPRSHERPKQKNAGLRTGGLFTTYHKTISSVPAPMSRQPIRDLGVKRSCKNTNASTSVMTTLSLSIGTTFDASPICSAR